MTSKSPDRNNDASEPDHQQACMLYLLGELDDASASHFEQQLQTSPELGEELLRQAEVISALSQSTLVPSANAASPMRRRHLQWAAVLVAVAACIAFAVISVRPATPSSNLASDARPAVSEDTLIAQAWASSRSTALEDLDFAEPEFDADFVDADEDVVDVDATLTWMYVAVASEPDATVAEMPNDG